jgi:tRNA(Ile)-lysidine synthase
LKINATFQATLNTQLDDWAKRFGSRFTLAVSGGGDSMALALGCANWMQAGKGFVHAVCVDHGLRDGSDHEAQQTVAWAHALGLSAEVVSLELKRGLTRVQERARAGRHQALVKAAKRHSTRIILLAHNQDDQHETIALRLRSKTGLDGLAGMAALSPSPFYEDDWPCLLGRPLLDIRREALREVLEEAGQDWHEDPSNTNPAFARIRTRSRLAFLQETSADTLALSRIAQQAGALRSHQDHAARGLLVAAHFGIEDGWVELAAAVLNTARPATGARVLGWLAFAVGGGARSPDQVKSARLADTLRQANFSGATLAGARFALKGDKLIITSAPLRKAQKTDTLRKTRDINLRLQAISGNLEQFVTYLG